MRDPRSKERLTAAAILAAFAAIAWFLIATCAEAGEKFFVAHGTRVDQPRSDPGLTWLDLELGPLWSVTFPEGAGFEPVSLYEESYSDVHVLCGREPFWNEVRANETGVVEVIGHAEAPSPPIHLTRKGNRVLGASVRWVTEPGGFQHGATILAGIAQNGSIRTAPDFPGLVGVRASRWRFFDSFGAAIGVSEYMSSGAPSRGELDEKLWAVYRDETVDSWPLPAQGTGGYRLAIEFEIPNHPPSNLLWILAGENGVDTFLVTGTSPDRFPLVSHLSSRNVYDLRVDPEGGLLVLDRYGIERYNGLELEFDWRVDFGNYSNAVEPELHVFGSRMATWWVNPIDGTSRVVSWKWLYGTERVEWPMPGIVKGMCRNRR